jgi:alpha-1,2-mannosyltransferase
MSARASPPLPDIMAAGLLAALSAALIVRDLISARGLVLPGDVMLGHDFLNAWTGGQLTAHGRVAEIYSSGYMTAVDQLVGHTLSVHAFSYPPTALLFLWPLGFIGYLPAFLLWVLATGTAFVVAARPHLARAGLPAWIAVFLPASLINVWAGHYGFVFSALLLAAFSSLEKRPFLAGWLIALLTFKPHMGVLIPLVLLVRGAWKAIIAAVAGTATLVAASLLFFGLEPWRTYLVATTSLQAHLLIKQHAFFFAMMPTTYAGFWVAFGNMPMAIAAQCMSAGVAIFIVVRAALKRIPTFELGLLSATATFLVLPYAFNYDMPIVGLSAAMLLFDGHRRLDRIGRVLALTAFGTPFLVLWLNPIGIPILPLALLGFLWVQARSYGVWNRELAPLTPALAAGAPL